MNLTSLSVSAMSAFSSGDSNSVLCTPFIISTPLSRLCVSLIERFSTSCLLRWNSAIPCEEEREGGRKGGRDGEREGGREGEREGEGEGGREGGREGEKVRNINVHIHVVNTDIITTPFLCKKVSWLPHYN